MSGNTNSEHDELDSCRVLLGMALKRFKLKTEEVEKVDMDKKR